MTPLETITVYGSLIAGSLAITWILGELVYRALHAESPRPLRLVEHDSDHCSACHRRASDLVPCGTRRRYGVMLRCSECHRELGGE
jgi:hypothetical protein